MKCPACRTVALTQTTLDPGLFAQSCGTCAGTWLSSSSYWGWRQHAGEQPEPEPGQDKATPNTDSTRAMICPDCGHIMLRYRIGSGLSFGLDHCGTCNGVWFDKDEWTALRSRGLHRDLPRRFGEAWQRRVWIEERQQARQTLFLEKFGDEDYAEIKRIRAWLEHHPRRIALLAYLNDTDPEKPAMPFTPLQNNRSDET